MKRELSKNYGQNCKIVASINENDICSITKVLYKNPRERYWSTHLVLGFIYGKKSTYSSTCFGGSDFESLAIIAQAQSDAFKIHGSNLENLIFNNFVEMKKHEEYGYYA